MTFMTFWNIPMTSSKVMKSHEMSSNVIFDRGTKSQVLGRPLNQKPPPPLFSICVYDAPFAVKGFAVSGSLRKSQNPPNEYCAHRWLLVWFGGEKWVDTANFCEKQPKIITSNSLPLLLSCLLPHQNPPPPFFPSAFMMRDLRSK